MVSAMLDLKHLPGDLMDNIKILGNSSRLAKIIDYGQFAINKVYLEIFSKLLKEKSIIRKFSIVNDPEAKSRVVGILDY